MTRTLTTEAFAISLKWLKKKHQLNKFKEYFNEQIIWRLGDKVYLVVTYDLLLHEDPSYILLKYSYRGQEVEQKVLLEMTKPHLGGERFWFVCPITGKRCTILYLPFGGTRFASREAFRMAYPIQQLSQEDWRWHKAKKYFTKSLSRVEY
jgi:hypothetical protein